MIETLFVTNRIKIALLIFIFFLSVYILTMKGYLEISDSYFSLRTAQSIIENNSMEIAARPSEEFFTFEKDGRRFSKYGIGLPLLWVPFVLAGKMISAITHIPASLAIPFAVSTCSVFFGAGLCVLYFFLGRYFGLSNKTSILMTFVLGLGTICWKYSVYDFSEIVQTFLLLLSIYGILRNSRASIALSGCAFSYALLIKFMALIYLPAALTYIVFRNRSDRTNAAIKIFYFVIAVALGLCALLYSNYVRFGNIFETGYGDKICYFSYAIFFKNFQALVFSLGKGIVSYSPVLALSAIGFVPFFKAHKIESLLFLAILVINIMAYSFFVYCGGGWAWGPRFQVPIVPFALFPIAFLIENNKYYVKLFVVLVGISIAVQAIGVFQKDQEYHHIVNGPYLDAATKAKMPTMIVGSSILLAHKITKSNNVYSLREFGIDSDRVIDTSSFETFRGLNLWYVRIADYFKNPLFLLAPLTILPFTMFALLKLLRIIKE